MTPNAMVGKRQALLAVLLILSSPPGLPARGRARGAAATRILRIDLAAQDPSGPRKESVEPASDVTIEITNRLPNAHYNVDVLRQVIEIPPFEWPKPKDSGRAESAKALTECQKLFNQPLAELGTAKDEKLVPSLVSQLNALIKAHPKCSDEIAKARSLTERTTEIVAQHVVLPEGLEIVVRIERIEPLPSRTWERTFSTGERGRWMTTYGFNFIPSREPRYFSRPSETEAGRFTIEREKNRRGLDFTPSVYFSWIATKLLLRDVAWGLTGGLGFDLSNPVIFVAPSLTYNWNLSFMAGLSMHKERRLRGRYRTGEPIGANLSNEELTDESYRPAPFFGIAYRFGSNPFSAPAPGGVVGLPSPTATPTPAPSNTPSPSPTATRTPSPV